MDAIGPFANLAIVLGLFQVVSYFQLAVPENTDYIRALYAVAITIQLSALYMIRTSILNKNDETVLQYQEPKKPFEDKEPEIVVTNVRDYDLQQVMAQLSQMGISVLILGVMHFKFGYLPPLIMQSFMGVKALFSIPAFQVHILNKAAVGDLSRPWKAKTMFDAPGANTPLGAKEVKQKERKDAKKRASGKKLE